MMQAEWLPIIMQGSFSEIYVVDCDTLRLMQSNKSARKNLGYTIPELTHITLLDVARHLSRAPLENRLLSLRCGRAKLASLETIYTRKDGSTYPVELRVFCHCSDAAARYIVIGNDISARRVSAKAPTKLSAHIESTKEKERARIAREIHDDLGGNLTAIKMAMAQVKNRLPSDDTALAKKAAYVDELIDRTIEAAHRLSADLRPGILDSGLVSAIGWQASEFEKQLGIPCKFSTNRNEISLHPDHATALFRIFQETLTNIGKHANASRVSVRLMSAKRSVQLKITDNGSGIAPTDRLKPQSFGIRGMMERTDTLGGQLSISNASGGGTVVALRIPLSE